MAAQHSNRNVSHRCCQAQDAEYTGVMRCHPGDQCFCFQNYTNIFKDTLIPWMFFSIIKTTICLVDLNGISADSKPMLVTTKVRYWWCWFRINHRIYHMMTLQCSIDCWVLVILAVLKYLLVHTQYRIQRLSFSQLKSVVVRRRDTVHSTKKMCLLATTGTEDQQCCRFSRNTA